ncbi:Pentatricopeptide repeat-containing protein [Drosera capensis]
MESLSQLPPQAPCHEISRFQSLKYNPKFTINFTSSINFSSPICLKPRWASSISQIQPPKLSATNHSVWWRATSRRAKNQRNLPSSDKIDVALQETKIHGHCKGGRTREAVRAFEVLEESGIVPHVITYTVLIRSYCKDRNVHEALLLLDQMKVAPDVVTYNTLLTGLCDSGKTEQGRELLAEMKDKGLKPDVVTYTSLVTGLAREGNLDEAINLLESFKDLAITPTMITFSSIMSGLCKTGQADGAIDFLGYMEKAPFVQKAEKRELGSAFLESFHATNGVRLVDSWEEIQRPPNGYYQHEGGPPQKILSSFLHSFVNSSGGGFPFLPTALPVLRLTKGDRQCIRDRSSIMVDVLLSSLDIDNLPGKGFLPGRHSELEDYWNASQGKFAALPPADGTC